MFKDRTDGKISSYTQLLLFVDGGCAPKNPGGLTTAGWVIFDPKNRQQALAEEGRVVCDGGPEATNNTGEYSALCFALTYLDSVGWRGDLTIKADSRLLVEQVHNRWKCNAPHLAKLREQVWSLLTKLQLALISESEPLPPEGQTSCQFVWVPRSQNEYANNLCQVTYQEHKQ